MLQSSVLIALSIYGSYRFAERIGHSRLGCIGVRILRNRLSALPRTVVR